MSEVRSEVPREGTTELVRRLDAAVAGHAGRPLLDAVKDVLIAAVRGQSLALDAALLVPDGDRYARRLLHRDPSGRYAIVVMVWAAGQGTPLHDHAGLWCVECVYRGRLRITSYERLGSSLGAEAGGTVAFRRAAAVTAGVGEAGALIPPFEYHVMENQGPEQAVTVHVYGGEMAACNVFLPIESGQYRQERRVLSYTP